MGKSSSKPDYTKQQIQETKPLSDNNQNEIKNVPKKSVKEPILFDKLGEPVVTDMIKESQMSKPDTKSQNTNLIRGIFKRMSGRNKKSKHKRVVSPIKETEKIPNNRPSSLITFKTENTETLSIQDYNSQVISINTDNASILTLNSGLIKGIQIDDNRKSSERISIELNVVKEMDKYDPENTTAIQNTTKELNGEYFSSLLNQKIQSLSSKISTLKSYQTLPNLPDETTGTINSAIGGASLLIKSKFTQFQKLCDSNTKADWAGGDNASKIDENGDPRPTNLDLQGFWEMMMIQVENVENKFDLIEEIKNNKWILVESEPKLEKKCNSIPILNSTRPLSAQSSRNKIKNKVGSSSCNTTPTRGRKSKGKQGNSALREQIKAARKAKLEADKNVESKSSSALERGFDNFVILEG